MAQYSNGCEGIILDEQCSECIFGNISCPIALVQTIYNYDQVGNQTATEILEIIVSSENGCSMFELIKAKLNENK